MGNVNERFVRKFCNQVAAKIIQQPIDFLNVLISSWLGCRRELFDELACRLGTSLAFVVSQHKADNLWFEIFRTILVSKDAGTMDRLANAANAEQASVKRADMNATDRELEHRIVIYLAARHVPGLRHLDVRAHNGIVTLSGQVLTFYEKQLCNQCCLRVAGVLQLINEVDVVGIPGTASVA